MESRYRQIIEKYKKHRKAFINEKLMPEEAEILAAQLAIAESVQGAPAVSTKKQTATIDQVRIFDINLKNIKKISDFTIDLEIYASNGKQCLLELDGESALRLMFFLKLLFTSKTEGKGYSENTLQEMEGTTLKNAYLDIEERTSSTALHRSINQRLKRRTGIKELIRNTARRNEHGNWVLLLSPAQIQFEGKLSQSSLLKM